MKLTIDFHYPITFIPYRHQNTQSETGQATAEVEVRELSDAEAPVAMLVGNAPAAGLDRHEARLALKEDGTPRRVRTYMGRHFVEAGPADGLQEQVLPGNVMKSFFGRAKPRSLSIDEARYGKKVMTGDEVARRHSSAAKPFREFKDDKGAGMAAKLRRLAAMMLVVDGVAYEYTPEPIIRITHRYGENKAVIGPRPAAGERYDVDSFDFRIFEFGEPVRSSLRHAETVRDLAAGADWPFFEVMDPASSAFDGTGYDVAELARKAERSLASSAEALPWSLLEAYYDLRDALADAQGRVTPRLVAALSEVAAAEVHDDPVHVAAVAANAVIKDAHGYDRRETIFTKRAAYLEKGGPAADRALAAEALERWERRPEGEHWENGVGPVSSLVSGGVRTMEVLSAGMAADLARRAGIDVRLLLREAEGGARVIVREEAPHSSAPGRPCFALAGPDGALRLLPGTSEAAAKGFREYLDHAEAAAHEAVHLAPAPALGGF